MMIIIIIMIMGSQVETSGAGWEAPEDPLDRDPPRLRGVAWPRLRRSRSAQGDPVRKADLNESNRCCIFFISST